jgi:hypothetical protein
MKKTYLKASIGTSLNAQESISFKGQGNYKATPPKKLASMKAPLKDLFLVLPLAWLSDKVFASPSQRNVTHRLVGCCFSGCWH